MSLCSTAQLHTTTALLDSLSKLHRHRLTLLRRSHSSTRPNLLSVHHRPPSPPSWIRKWKQSPIRILPRRPRSALDYRNSDVTSDDEAFGTSRTARTSTMEKIVDKLRKFGYVDDDGTDGGIAKVLPEKGSVEDIFYAEDGVLPNARGGLMSAAGLDEEEDVRFPWERSAGDGVGEGNRGRKKKSHTCLAELTLPEGEFRRLRKLAFGTKSKIKIGGAGVTKDIIDRIHEKWMTEEIVRVKCEGPPALNMKRMHEILERKTGGLVIWRSGNSISLYRGVTYELPVPLNKSRNIYNMRVDSFHEVGIKPVEHSLQNRAKHLSEGQPESSLSLKKSGDAESSTDTKYEDEVNKILDEIGPRFTDWPGSEPLPVDADLLPGIVPGYSPPFRVLPYGVSRGLGMKDQTKLRKLARTLPPHFVIGRSRQLQGLASAMVKLWEKSSIAKIALKRGVQLTTSEQMAESLKRLTGGTLLSRNKDYIVFYRGKDFLSIELTNVLMERERLAETLQDEEEQARQRASLPVSLNIEMDEPDEPRTAGTLNETLEADARWGKQLDDNIKNAMLRAAELERHASLVRKLERRLIIAENRLLKAEKALAQVEEFLQPAEQKIDPESITEEERFMFRKLGLKMKAFLLLGRRGVFDGTVENMHLHWKYRELVKIMIKAKTLAQVKNVALALEAESGGVLVSVDKVSKGYAIIVYRGKDYKRPSTLRPKNLLTKRKALARSIELQRREALLQHVSRLQKKVETLKLELSQMEAAEGHGDEELYDKLDTMYLSTDEDTEDEGDATCLEFYDGGINSCSKDDKSEAYDPVHDQDDFDTSDDDILLQMRQRRSLNKVQ